MNTNQRLAGFIILLAAPLAQAAPITSQTVIDGGFGTYANNSAGAQVADNFTLNQEYQITGLTWWGSYDPDISSDDFTISIYSESGGAPNITADIMSESITATRSGTLFEDAFSSPIYEYAVSLDLLLGTGNYFLSVSNESNTDWFWADGESGDLNNWFFDPFGNSWDTNTGYDMAFAFAGDATQVSDLPEPASLILLLAGLTGLYARRRQS